MKTICNILILILLILFLWNFLIKSKESFRCDIAMGQYKQCFKRHQGRNNKSLSRVNNEMSKLDGLLTKLMDRHQKVSKEMQKTQASIGGLEKVAKGEPRENPPEACDKSPESC